MSWARTVWGWRHQGPDVPSAHQQSQLGRQGSAPHCNVAAKFPPVRPNPLPPSTRVSKVQRLWGADEWKGPWQRPWRGAVPARPGSEAPHQRFHLGHRAPGGSSGRHCRVRGRLGFQVPGLSAVTLDASPNSRLCSVR